MKLTKFLFSESSDIKKFSQCDSISKGFTIIELLVVVAIIGIVSMIGLPAFQETIQDRQMVPKTNGLVGALNLARLESIKRGTQVIVAPSGGANWNGTISVWLDTNRNGTIDNAEEVLRVVESDSDGSAFVTASTSVIFLSTGFVASAARFELCDNRAGETGREITVLISGRIRSTDFGCQ